MKQVFYLFVIVMTMIVESLSQDTIWHNKYTGAIKGISINQDYSIESQTIWEESTNTNLKPVGMGDFTGDGIDDILARNPETGKIVIWDISKAGELKSFIVTTSSNINLTVAGVGDFDSDGDVDIAVVKSVGTLSIWEMDGTTLLGIIPVKSGLHQDLIPMAVGDLNGDSIPDIVLQNSEENWVKVFIMGNNNTYSHTIKIKTDVSSDLKVQHISDINGDGDNDILLQNEVTGLFKVWTTDGTPTVVGVSGVMTETDLNWSLVGVYKDNNTLTSISLLSPQESQSIPYDHITLELDARSTTKVSALNTTLANEHNRSLLLKAYLSSDNNNTTDTTQHYYIYNLPLIAGANDINITATNEHNETITRQVTLTADANGTAPIGMRATEFSGIQRLDTNITIATLLNVEEYLLDSDGDGIIDDHQTNSDQNTTATDQNQTVVYPTVNRSIFQVSYTTEGRYKPRATIRTADNLLYSSDSYALSLDVKADADQKDPKGAEPMDVAKEFVAAIVGDDREAVERFLGGNQKLIDFIYSHPDATAFIRKTYQNITNWEQTYHSSGDASIKILFDAEGQSYGGGFEMTTVNQQINTGRMWVIRFIY